MRYSYNGPVKYFDKFYGYWSGETTAPSLKKAKVNLCYQCKKHFGMYANAPIKLTNKIKEEN